MLRKKYYFANYSDVLSCFKILSFLIKWKWCAKWKDCSKLSRIPIIKSNCNHEKRDTDV